jgi:hypothetical protein
LNRSANTWSAVSSTAWVFYEYTNQPPNGNDIRVARSGTDYGSTKPLAITYSYATSTTNSKAITIFNAW